MTAHLREDIAAPCLHRPSMTSLSQPLGIFKKVSEVTTCDRRRGEHFCGWHGTSMRWRMAADGQRLALLVFAYAAFAADHANAHTASRRSLSSQRNYKAARHLHSADSSTLATNVTDIPQIHSRKCGVADVSVEQARQVTGDIANNFELRQQVRQACTDHVK